MGGTSLRMTDREKKDFRCRRNMTTDYFPGAPFVAAGGGAAVGDVEPEMLPGAFVAPP